MRSSTYCLLFAFVALGSPTARAQSPSASAQAQRLFDGGRALLQAGKIAEACAAFESSRRLESRASTLLNLASCREKNGQLATARAAFAAAERLAHIESNDKLVNVALNHISKLDVRVSKLTLVVADRGVPGLEILRDGEKVDAASWNVPVPVDGGNYTITARAPGRAEWTVTTPVKSERDLVKVEIPTLPQPRAAVAEAPRPAATPSPSETVTDPHAVESSPTAGRQVTPLTTPEAGLVDGGSGRPTYVAPILVGAGALALVGIGLYEEIASRSTWDDAKALNAAGARDAAESKKRDADRQRITGEVFDVAAIAAAGVAVYLAIRVHRSRASETIAVYPVAGAELSGIGLSGRW